ncbi:hypothetical protein ACFYPT_31480 [Streptomyces sp. NPDC005529]|uniref:hypothetical protein n=1 Tax=unclassified Streptomyces TaxID=2593676 RepID=UPI0033A6110A
MNFKFIYMNNAFPHRLLGTTRRKAVIVILKRQPHTRTSAARSGLAVAQPLSDAGAPFRRPQ